MRRGFAKRLIAGLLLATVAFPSLATDVRAARIWDSPEYTRAVFDLAGPVEYKLFILDNPARVVLDLRSSSLSRDYAVPAGKGVVKALRSGRPTPSDLRIVIDLAAKARAKSFLLPPAEGKGHRLVVDLYGREAEMKQVVKSVASIVPPDERDVIVAIDAGHGGEDPGAIGATGKREKDITLATAKVLAEVIEAEPGMTAVLIRDGDYFVPLKKRYEKAREARADLFISIHADAFHKRSAAGSSVFMLSQRGASSEAARWLADRENASDLVGGVSLDDKDGTLAAVLLDLSQGATLASSGAVAMHVLQGISGLGKLHKRDVQRANFVVLRSPDVPSILVETAFISNPAEEKRLTNPVEQRKLADAILTGVRDYFHAAPPPGTWIAMHPQPPRQHIVARGESLSLIAQRHRVTLAALRSANKLRSDTVRVGDVLRIPTSS
ncbi:MAG TPA: N-acetylmuramoyl-L-alanine amidase [Xanthomonadales bacterium]|nr:N-acetylmuramoyl-L-alanine amidase [Xanthomonadales bacterium]